jgi:hypothetical protein
VLFLTDENVPDAVGRFFKQRGHEVRLARETFREGASDRTVVEGCEALHAIVVTWNKKDFTRLVGRRPPDGNQQRYRHVGAIYFACLEPMAVKRLQQLYDVIELEVANSMKRSDKRVFIEIADDYIRINR